MFDVLCIDSNTLYEYEDSTYNDMCMAGVLTFDGPEHTPTLPTEDDVKWWYHYERAVERIVDAAIAQGVTVTDVADELGIVWDDLEESVNKLATYFGVPGID